MSIGDDRVFLGDFEARRIERMLGKLHLGRLGKDEVFEVSGSRDRDWLAVQFCLARGDRSLVYRVDARVARKSSRLTDDGLKTMLIDLLGHCFEGYLKAPREPFSGPNWESVDYEGHVIWLQGQEVNERAEVLGRSMLDDDAPALGRTLATAAQSAAEGDERP